MQHFPYLPGDDLQLTVTWAAAGTPVDLTDYDARFSVDIPDGTDVELTPGDGLTVTEAAGRIEVLITHDITAGWTTDLNYRLRVTSPADIITTLIWGRLVYQDAIT